ncbi:MAG: CoB--CoM heterodisulfide reductase iron-sulfur subunit B family protein [Pseudomonadota bacterium]
MDYLYYPGCSLEGTAKEYDLSTRAVLERLGVGLRELPGWTCCGATAAEAVGRLLSLALPARNLALAAAMDQDLDLLVPCSACYLNLKKTEEVARTDPVLKKKIDLILAEIGLRWESRARTRHLLDVLSRDLGPEAIRSRVVRPLAGLKVAPYYGCQCLRPHAVFDDPEYPVSMEPLIHAAGAEVFSWSMGGRCCGASHMTTKPAAGRVLVEAILEEARGADVLITVCPMCQMNLEAVQAGRMGPGSPSVLYLPQLLGLALGLPGDRIHLNMNLAVGREFLREVA